MSETPVWRQNARTWKALQPDETEAGPTIGLATSFTVNALVPQLGMAWYAETSQRPSLIVGEHNQLHQSCLDPASHFKSEVDTLILLWRVEDLFWTHADGAIAGDQAAFDAIIADAEELAELAKAASQHVSVVFGLPPAIDDPNVDRLDQVAQRSLRKLHRRLCDAIDARLATAAGVTLFDLEVLVSAAGRLPSYARRKDLLYRQPYTDEFFALLGAELGRSLITRTRSFPKCIAVDCDNTLWGGVIGEDGLEGIVLSTDFPGSAFQALQLQLRRLKDQGILLAIVSKNDHEAVKEVFDLHPGMVLTEDDIAAWRVNWTPKSENIRSLSDELNFATDAFVFVDDSHFEINEVRAALPEVRLLKVPEEPAEIPQLLPTSSIFRGLTANDDDVERTRRIQQEAKRKSATEAMTHDDFLASLRLQVRVHEMAPESLERTTQLINKTNQFNLTTIRRTAAEVDALSRNTSSAVLTCQVTDRFGDYGLVGVVILTGLQGKTAELDTFLLSCRVLGRGVEFAVLTAACEHAAEAGVASVVGKFESTLKNGQVADFYERGGFKEVDATTFSQQIEQRCAAPSHIDLGTTESS